MSARSLRADEGAILEHDAVEIEVNARPGGAVKGVALPVTEDVLTWL